MIVHSACQLADRIENGFRSAGEVQRSHLDGLTGMVDTIRGRFVFSGGVNQEPRG